LRAMPHRTLGERLRAARKHAKLTLAAIAEALAREVASKTFTPQAVQQWEKDRTEPDHATLIAFARLTGVNAHWLLTGISVDQVSGDDGEFGTAVRGGRVVPKISLLEAITLVPSYKTTEYVHTHFDCSDKAFVIDVFDARNAPEYLPDVHRVVIDPEIEPQPGDMVLARIDGAPVFGKYTRARGGIVEIHALNEDWEPRRVDVDNGDRVIGVMTEHAKPRRR
jgi:transcriptional regulator with XRE-family HTH domain